MVGRIAAVLCAALLALTACEPAEDDGVPPGGDGGRLPDARTTDGGDLPDAGSFDADPSDVDGDGVDNGADNCPAVANAGQEDEDGDVVGDVCDNCPTEANAAQGDMQEISNNDVADGVGDACDPRPTAGGDAIAFFDGFNGSTLAADWADALGTWTVAGGALHQGSAAVQAAVVFWTAEPGERARIETEVTIDQIAPAQSASDTTRTAGTLARLALLAGTGYACVEYANPGDIAGTTQLLLYEATGSGATTLSATDPGWNMAVDDPIVVRMQVRTSGNRQLCRLARIAGGNVQVTASDTTLTSGNLGLTTYGLAASFRYAIVYTLGN